MSGKDGGSKHAELGSPQPWRAEALYGLRSAAKAALDEAEREREEAMANLNIQVAEEEEDDVMGAELEDRQLLEAYNASAARYFELSDILKELRCGNVGDALREDIQASDVKEAQEDFLRVAGTLRAVQQDLDESEKTLRSARRATQAAEKELREVHSQVQTSQTFLSEALDQEQLALAGLQGGSAAGAVEEAEDEEKKSLGPIKDEEKKHPDHEEEDRVVEIDSQEEDDTMDAAPVLQGNTVRSSSSSSDFPDTPEQEYLQHIREIKDLREKRLETLKQKQTAIRTKQEQLAAKQAILETRHGVLEKQRKVTQGISELSLDLYDLKKELHAIQKEAECPGNPDTVRLSTLSEIATACGKCWCFFTRFREWQPRDVAMLTCFLVLIAFMATSVIPQLWWMATVGFPNFLPTAQGRFLDRGPPTPVSVYNDWCPTILNVPIFERLEWYAIRLPFFMFRMFSQFPVALFYALWYGYETQPIPEDTWTKQWSDGWPSEFLVHKFAKDLEWTGRDDLDDAEYTFFEASFEVMDTHWDYDENCYGAGSRIAFRRKKLPENCGELGTCRYRENLMLETIAILLSHKDFLPDGPVVFYPDDKAWDASKTFALHGAVHRYVLALHPMRHFPMDSVNGLTKNMNFMPNHHIIHQLLKPHFHLTLPLEDAVMNSWFLSILLNPYFLHPFDNRKGTVILTYAVWEFSHYNFSEMHLTDHPHDRPSARNDFLRKYQKPLREFIDTLVDLEEPQFINQHTERWGDEIARHVPGFPTGKALISDKELLKQTLTDIISDLSFEHALQHWQFAHEIPLVQQPWSIHKSPPRSRDEVWSFEEASMTFSEYVVYHVTNKVFFYFGPHSRVQDIDYGFPSKALQQAQQKMVDSWMEIEESLRRAPDVFPYYPMPLENIGPSIDY